ncbi:MAG: galactonate dehydratase [Akkermansiaceae bacterium]
MKITQLNLYKVRPRWVFLEIETDEGISGWGEPVLEGQAETVMAAVRELELQLIGKDPGKINELWNEMFHGQFYHSGPILMSAIAGIDQALWDIKGKALGLSVVELLGGSVRGEMKTYSWVGGDDPSDEISQIEKARKNDGDTFKLNGCGRLRQIASHRDIDAAVSRVYKIREHFGSEIDFALDFHGRVSLPMAKVLLKEMENARPLFVEEPVLPEYAHAYKDLAMRTSIPLAAGERAYSRYDFRPILEAGGLSILQPDLSHAGGITECLKIASMAETYNVALAPHCPLGPLALASCLAVDFVSPNAMLQEQSLGIHYNDGLELTSYIANKDDFAIKDGCISPLPKPGLGVEIDKDFVIEQGKIEHNWTNPSWHHEDGSIAHW